jgi:hypothetical protein
MEKSIPGNYFYHGLYTYILCPRDRSFSRKKPTVFPSKLILAAPRIGALIRFNTCCRGQVQAQRGRAAIHGRLTTDNRQLT